MRAKLTALFALGFGPLVLIAFAGCGSLHTTSASDTPTGPQATATALFVNINRKRVLSSEPTFAPGTDPIRPFADVTSPPEPTDTPGPSPTPVGPSCGATIAGWPEILANYGGFYKGNRCGPFETAAGAQLVIATNGVDGGPGAIATYTCEPTDEACLHGDAPQQPGAAWSVYPAPFPGGVEVLVSSGTPDSFLLAGGHYCFNLDTHLYNVGCY